VSGPFFIPFSIFDSLLGKNHATISMFAAERAIGITFDSRRHGIENQK